MRGTIKADDWRDVPAASWRWPSFSPAELASKGDGSILMSCNALDRLQRVRDELGVPMLITSAYRDPEHNRRTDVREMRADVRAMARRDP
ncbi:MAG: zinc D-Ala-D-Ala carboxypeptidase [Paracoccaceae bacterium]|jgi:zinc D-Ala-D-Ala carboxypeptidase